MIFLQTFLIPVCDLSSLTFPMMYSAYKANKQGDNIQPCCAPFPILNQSVVPNKVLNVASWPTYRFLKRQVMWSGVPSLQEFQFVVCIKLILCTVSGSDSKESTCNVGDLGSIPGLVRSPRGGHGNPLQYSYLEDSHGQRNLKGYSPWGHKELDTTEQLSSTLTPQNTLLLARQDAIRFMNHWIKPTRFSDLLSWILFSDIPYSYYCL